ncbi:MAG: OmpL47-type beta-barrel domain-containing protein [Candidatus Nanoarchaeia archaeon]
MNKTKNNFTVLGIILFLGIILYGANTYALIDSITDLSPVDEYNTSNTNPDFTFTVSGNNSLYDCAIYIDGEVNKSYINISNGSMQTISILGSFTDGTYAWYINCTDDDGDNVSIPRNINIDATAPVIAIDDDADTEWTNSDTISVTRSDAGTGIVTTVYIINETDVCNESVDDLLDAGSPGISVSANYDLQYYNKYICFRTIDYANNKNYAVSDIIDMLDTVDPDTTDNYDDSWQNAAFDITLTPTDVAGTNNAGVNYTTYSVDGDWANGTVVSINTSGNHTVVYYSVDNAGNVETENTIYALLDLDDPYVEFDDDAETEWTTTMDVISVTSTDGTSEVVTMLVVIDNNTCDSSVDGLLNAGTEADNIQINNPFQQNKYVCFRATDEAGNTYYNVSGIVDRLDLEAPVTIDDYDGLWQNAVFDITLTAEDVAGNSNSGVNYTTYSVDGDWANGTVVSINTSGNHTVVYYSVDTAGNVETENTIYALLDLEIPSLEFDDDAEDTDWTSMDVISVVGDDAVSGVAEIVLIVNDNDTCDSSVDDLLDAGTPSDNVQANDESQYDQYVCFRVTDNAGNVNYNVSGQITKLDVTNPDTTDDYNDSWQDAVFNITLTAVDNLSEHESEVNYTTYLVEGGVWTNGTIIAINASGNFTILYYSVDNVGNIETNNTIYALLDLTEPVITITAPAEGDRVGSSESITFTVDESFSAVDTECRIDAAEWVSCSESGDVMSDITGFSDLDVGDTFTFEVRGTDEAGNVGTDSVTLEKRSSSSGGSSSSAPVRQNNMAKQSWVMVLPNDRILFKPGKSGIPVDEVNFVLKKNKASVTMEAAGYDSKPGNVPDLKGALKYMEIKADGVTSEDIDGLVTLKFSIAVSSTSSPEKVHMFRLVGGSWTELDTLYLYTENGKYYYTANTPGFSYFAVGVSEPAATNTPETVTTEPTVTETGTGDQIQDADAEQVTDTASAQPGETDTANTDTKKSGGSIWTFVIIVVVVVILAAIIVESLRRRKHRK